MRLNLKIAALGAVVTLAACGTSVKRMDSNEVVGRQRALERHGLALVAEEMISDCLSRPWYSNAQSDLGKNPTVIVGSVRNKSSEHIATDTFIEDLQRTLINSGKVNFVASKHERGDVRDERADQDTNASRTRATPTARRTGANFMLSGAIDSIVDQADGQAVVFYQTNLKLLNMKTNQIVWNGQKKIKKLVSRSRSSF